MLGEASPFKGEVQSRITINFKRKSKNFPTDWCKNYENRIRNKEVVTFLISHFFRKHFLTSPYEYSNEWVDDVITSQFSTHFIYKTDKNLIFPSLRLWECKPCLISTQNKWEIMFILIYFDTRICFYLYLEKYENFQNFMYNIWQIVRRWHHQLTHLNIHKDWSRNVFRKNVKFQNVTTSLFLIDFHHFCTNL